MPFTEQPFSADASSLEKPRSETIKSSAPLEFLEEKKRELQVMMVRAVELENLADNPSGNKDQELAAIKEEERSLMDEWQVITAEVVEQDQVEAADESWRQAAADRFGVPDFNLEQFQRSSFHDEAVTQAFLDGKDWHHILENRDQFISGESYDAANEAFYAMEELENEVPGSVARLNKEFGISNFQRYPKEMLLNQLQTGDKEKEAGLLVFAAEDWNGAFDNQQAVWQKLYDQQKDSRNFRIVECRSSEDLRDQLLKAHQDFDKKISFLALSAHSELDGFHLGSEKDAAGGFVSQENLAQLKLTELIAPRAQILANACSSASVNGWARGLSRETGINIVGPDRPAGIEDIDFVGQEVVPKYYNNNIYSNYYQGFLMSKKQVRK